MIKIIIPVVPVAKGRARHCSRGGRVWSYTPKKTKDYEDIIRCYARPLAPKALLSEALSFVMIFYIPVPKSISKKDRIKIETNLMFPIKKPDLDNLTKTKDALKGIIFTDDSIMVHEKLIKVYSPNPRTEIRIAPIKEIYPFFKNEFEKLGAIG